MFLVLLIGLGVGAALGESTSSVDDSDDTPSKLTEGYLGLHPLEVAWRNHNWEKSRSAGRDMSYSSSFGSEDFDSPDIPSDFHAKWGINKTWYVKTPHPILSRRESFENYGRAPLIDSTEVDSSEISSSSKDGAVSTRPIVTVTKSTTSTTKIATTLKIQQKSTLKSFISTVLPTKSQITKKQSVAFPPLPKSPSETKQTHAKLETSKTKVTPKAVSKLEEAHANPVKSPTGLPHKNSSPRQPPITHAGTTVSPIIQTKIPITITAITTKPVVMTPTGTKAAIEATKPTLRPSVAARAEVKNPSKVVTVAPTASAKLKPTAMQPTTSQQILLTTREQRKIVVTEKPQQTPKAPIILQNHPTSLKLVTHPSGKHSVEKPPPSTLKSEAHQQNLLPSTLKPSSVTLNFIPTHRAVLPSTLKAILLTSQSNSLPPTTVRVISVTKPETNLETSKPSSEKPIVVTSAPQQTLKTHPTNIPISVLNTLLPTTDKTVLVTNQPDVPISTTPVADCATKPNPITETVVPATPKSIILTTIKALTNSPSVVSFTTETTRSITASDKTEPNLQTQSPTTERITIATIQSVTLPTTSKDISLTTTPQTAEIPTTAAVEERTLSSISPDITTHFVVTHSHKSHAHTHTHTHPTYAPVPTQAHAPSSATKKPTMRSYDEILNKAGDLIRPKTTLKPTIKSKEHLITRDTTVQPHEHLITRDTTVQPQEHLITRDTTVQPQELHSTITEQHKPSPPSHVNDRANKKRDRIKLHPGIHETEITTSHFGIHTTEESQVHNTMTTPVVTRFKTRAWGPPLPKMDKSKRRRNDVIVLKPPPDDWPEPKAPEGAKMPPPPVFGATIPPMGTYIDTRIGRKGRGFSASSYHSPPYMGHRKIDFAPQYDRKVASDNEVSITSIPTMKWRIRGRRDRQGQSSFRHRRGGGYLNEIAQEPGFMRDLTMKPSVSKFFISDNATYLAPTVRSARPFQRNYFNFRMRPPGNVGRSFGPPEPPFPPPPPPRFAPNHPFGQPPFPQFPQPYPPFPHGPPPPHFGQGPPPLYGQGPPRPPPPPYGQGPPPPPPYGQGPPPPFGQGPPHFRPPPQYGPYEPRSPPPPGAFAPPGIPQPRGSPDSGFPGPPPSPPPPYPGGPELPPVRPFLDNIPTISPIDNIPAPWPRRQIQTEFKSPGFAQQPRVPDFLKNEPRNFSGYKGPRRGRGYEQYGKADLRPRHVKFFDEFSVRGTPPRFPARKGSGFGVEFQDDITRPSYMPDDFFGKRTWAPRVNKFGYEPYRRANDRRRPYGFGKYAAERPPVLGEFGQFKPYRRMDDTNNIPFNYSRPTRSYTFPPRLRLAIRNASFFRRTFRHSGFRGYTLPTLPSIGLEAYMAHDHDYHGNPIHKKGRITNLQDLKYLFTLAPEAEGEAATDDSEVATAVPEEGVMKPRITAKPKGMTAREAMRAAAREAMRETEMEDWEEGAGGGGRRRGWRRIGGSGGRRGQVIGRGGAGRGGMNRGGMGRGGMGRGGMGRGGGQRNFRRAKRSVEESEWLEKQERLGRSLGAVADYLTGPGASPSLTEQGTRSQHDVLPLRMRRWRVKGRPRARG